MSLPLLRKCQDCGRYTLKQKLCPNCGGVVKNPHPPKYSPEDRYGKYRRKAKRELRSKRNTVS